MKSTFTKKAFVSALNQADPNMVLCSVVGCSAESRQGAVIVAVERAAQKLLGVSMAPGMTHLTIGMGKTRKAPKWFSNMMLKVSWNARDLNVIRIGDLLAQC